MPYRVPAGLKPTANDLAHGSYRLGCGQKRDKHEVRLKS